MCSFYVPSVKYVWDSSAAAAAFEFENRIRKCDVCTPPVLTVVLGAERVRGRRGKGVEREDDRRRSTTG